MQIQVNPEHCGTRIDVFLAQTTDLSRSAVQKLLSDGESVSVNGLFPAKNYKIAPGDIIELEIPEPIPLETLPEKIPLDILFEDNDIIVVNKPRGMVVHPAPGHYSGTLVNALLYHCENSLSGIGGIIRPGIVHRIDRDTSGVLVVAKNDLAHVCLASQIKEHSVKRQYHGILVGNLREEKGTVNQPLARHPSDRKKMAVSKLPSARSAVTHYSVLEQFNGYCHCLFELETGRTHQIRVHMSYLSHPLLFDPVYGNPKNSFEQKYPNLIHGQCLHAATLGFLHPRTNQYMEFNAPLPADFDTVLTKIRV